MPGELPDDATKTAIVFLTRSLDKLDEGLTRLAQTVREDFATVGEIEVLKTAIRSVREELDRAIHDVRRDIEIRITDNARRIADLKKEKDGELGKLKEALRAELRSVRWFNRVAIPAAVLALLKVAWDAYWFVMGLKKP